MNYRIFLIVCSLSGNFSCKSRTESSDVKAPVPKGLKRATKVSFFNAVAGKYLSENIPGPEILKKNALAPPSEFPKFCDTLVVDIRARTEEEAKIAAEKNQNWSSLNANQQAAEILNFREQLIRVVRKQNNDVPITFYENSHDQFRCNDRNDACSQTKVDPTGRTIRWFYYDIVEGLGIAKELDFSDEDKMVCRNFNLEPKRNMDAKDVEKLFQASLPEKPEDTFSFVKIPKEKADRLQDR